MDRQTLDFGVVWKAFDELLLGAALTLRLTFLAVIFGMAIAVACAWAKTNGPKWIRPTVTFYVELIRNTPFLLQLYFFFFGLPSIGVRLAPNDAANEASWFLQNAAVASGDLVPVLDLEVSNGLDATALTTWAQTWLANVTAATGVKPLIYTNRNFWSTSMANTDWFAQNGYRVWIANWTTASQPALPAGNWGGQGWTFWQHSSTGVVAGISGDVDLDRFNGTSLPASLFVP